MHCTAYRAVLRLYKLCKAEREIYIKHGTATAVTVPPRELYLWVFPTVLTLAEPLITDGKIRRVRVILLLPAAVAVGVTASSKRFTTVTRINAEVLSSRRTSVICTLAFNCMAKPTKLRRKEKELLRRMRKIRKALLTNIFQICYNKAYNWHSQKSLSGIAVLV